MVEVYRDIEDAYCQILYKCMTRSPTVGEQSPYNLPYLQLVTEGSFVGNYRLQLPALAFGVRHSIGHRPFVSTPEGKPHLAVCDDKYIEEEYINYLMSTKRAENEAYTYGERINAPIWIGGEKNVNNCTVGWRKTTQIALVIEKLNKNRGTNQATTEIGRPEDIALKDPPCIRLIDYKIVKNKLYMSVYVRSWDAYAGLPNNLAGLQLMKEAIAVMTNLGIGVTYAYSSGAHVYQQDWPYACERLGYDYEAWLKNVENQFNIKLKK